MRKRRKERWECGSKPMQKNVRDDEATKARAIKGLRKVCRGQQRSKGRLCNLQSAASCSLGTTVASQERDEKRRCWCCVSLAMMVRFEKQRSRKLSVPTQSRKTVRKATLLTVQPPTRRTLTCLSACHSQSEKKSKKKNPFCNCSASKKKQSEQANKRANEQQQTRVLKF